MPSHPDYGYPWWLSYGHLVVTLALLPILLLGFRRKWPLALVLLVAIVAVWSGAAFLVARFVLDVNGPLALPTQAFFSSGEGRVLDVGAGTGRSTVMILEARPHASAVALDLFGESFDQHFGRGQSGVERLHANLRAAGVDGRAAIQPGDMRRLPFEPGTFEAVLSTYAMDHVRREESRVAVQEAARVLKPGGDFLLMVLAKDGWLEFTFGPLLLHGGLRNGEFWTDAIARADLTLMESGTRPATLYFLARKGR
jgi:SAM-dependent methyltransferase